MKDLFDRLIAETLRLGADHASVIDAVQIETDRSFRDACLSNACGMVGKCWMCPPEVGEIEELMAEVRRYDHALVYQRIGRLEDSFDVEGMADAKTAHREISFALRPLLVSLTSRARSISAREGAVSASPARRSRASRVFIRSWPWPRWRHTVSTSRAWHRPPA